MKLNNKVYDVLKWIVMIVLPAVTTAYVGLAAIWGFPYAEEVAKTSAVICTLLGALLGISTAEYNSMPDAAVDVEITHWSLEQLKAFCELNGVDAGNCLTREDYIEAIERMSK